MHVLKAHVGQIGPTLAKAVALLLASQWQLSGQYFREIKSGMEGVGGPNHPILWGCACLLKAFWGGMAGEPA